MLFDDMNLLKMLKFKVKGSATVEAALIFPLLMFFFVAFVYLTMIHYQNTVLTTESIRAMNRAGAFWMYADTVYGADEEKTIPAAFDTSSSLDELITKDMIKNRSAYRNIDFLRVFFALLGGKKVISKNDNATSYAESRIANIKFKNNIESTDVDRVKGGGYVLWNNIELDVSRSYINPLINSIEKFFGISYAKRKSIVVPARISNQAMFNRDVDLVFDLYYTLSGFIKKNNSEGSKE